MRIIAYAIDVMSVNNGIRNNDMTWHFLVITSPMDESKMREIFETTIKLLYACSIQTLNKDELTQIEKKDFLID